MTNSQQGLTSDRFTLTIDLGNDAMQEPHDIAVALRVIAQRIDAGEVAGRIRDENGNTVGEFDATR